MFYNLLQYDSNISGEQRAPILKSILDEIQPDIFMVSELKSEAASNYLFSNAIETHNTSFEKTPWQWGQSPDGSLMQTVYYNSEKLIYQSNKVIPTNTRDINRYTFLLNTADKNTNPLYLEVFVTHLKASTGETNENRRFFAIEDFVNELNTLSNTSFVLFSGDFNFYSSNERGYQKLIDAANHIVMVDPINTPSTDFWNNAIYANVHTQSTRTSNTGLIESSGSTGGLDDRFDFIMMSQNFSSNPNLYYVDDSYKTIGNNGNCYNSFIADAACSGTYSQSLRNNLLEFSDHLPVVMEIESPQNTLATTTYQLINFKQQNYTSDFLELVITNKTVREVTIYNQLGQVVISKKINGLDKNEIQINVQQLSRGIYYLSTSKNSVPLKFVKL